MSFFGVLQFNAPYLPWMLLLFSLVLGNPVEMDVLGIIVGHTYYFLDIVYPQVAEIRGWSLKKIIRTPVVLHYIFGTTPPVDEVNEAPIIIHDPLPPQPAAAGGEAQLPPQGNHQE
eukprot:gene31253-38616_t